MSADLSEPVSVRRRHCRRKHSPHDTSSRQVVVREVDGDATCGRLENEIQVAADADADIRGYAGVQRQLLDQPPVRGERRGLPLGPTKTMGAAVGFVESIPTRAVKVRYRPPICHVQAQVPLHSMFVVSWKPS